MVFVQCQGKSESARKASLICGNCSAGVPPDVTNFLPADYRRQQAALTEGKMLTLFSLMIHHQANYSK
jgi:hypothetical protein